MRAVVGLVGLFGVALGSSAGLRQTVLDSVKFDETSAKVCMATNGTCPDGFMMLSFGLGDEYEKICAHCHSFVLGSVPEFVDAEAHEYFHCKKEVSGIMEEFGGAHQTLVTKQEGTFDTLQPCDATEE